MHTKTLYIAALAIITLCGCEGIVDTVIPQPEPPADTSIVGVWDVETIDGLTLEMAIPGAENLANAFDIVTFSADGGFERIWGWALGPNDGGDRRRTAGILQHQRDVYGGRTTVYRQPHRDTLLDRFSRF